MTATARSTIVCKASLCSIIFGLVACGREDVELAGWIARDSVVEDAGTSSDAGRPFTDAGLAPCAPAPSVPACGAEGTQCEGDGDCCSDKCDDDTLLCKPSVDACLATGESCRDHEGDCCGVCDATTLRCTPPPPPPKCFATAAKCARNAECCSQLCVAKACAPSPCTSTTSTPTK